MMRSLPLALLPLLVGSATAQFTGFPTYAPPIFTRSVPDATAYGDTCTGQFFGSGYPDLAVVTDGAVTLHAMPCYNGGISTLSDFTGVTALTKRSKGVYLPPGCTAYRHYDELLVAHSGGLSSWWTDGTRQTALVAGSQLAGAVSLQTVDYDVDGDLDVLAISANRQFLYIVRNNGAAAATVLAYPAFQWLHSPIQAVSTLAVTGYVQRRIVVASANGLYLVPTAFSGSPTVAISAGGTDGVLCPVRTHAHGEYMAWIRRTGGVDVLRVYPNSQPEITLGALGVVAARTTDFDLNGEEDLLLSQTANHCMTMFMGLGGSPAVFGTGAFQVLQIQLRNGGELIPAAGNRSPMQTCDLDGDGDIDVLALDKEAHALITVPNYSDNATSKPWGSQVLTPLGGTFIVQNNEVQFSGQVFGHAAECGYDGIEMIGWRLLVLPVSGGGVDPQPVGRGVIQEIGALLESEVNDVSYSWADWNDLDLNHNGVFALIRPTRTVWELVGGVQLPVAYAGPAVPGYMAMKWAGADDLTPIQTVLQQWSPMTSGVIATLNDAIDGGTKSVGWVVTNPPPPSSSEGPN